MVIKLSNMISQATRKLNNPSKLIFPEWKTSVAVVTAIVNV